MLQGCYSEGRGAHPSFSLCSCSVFRTAASSRRLAGRERPSPAFTQKKTHRRKKEASPSSPSSVHYTPPAPPLCSLLTSPSHIRSSDWPIKYRKYVSTDECSAQAEKAQCEADSTSSSTTRTADISQRASTTRARPSLHSGLILHHIKGTDRTAAQPSSVESEELIE